MEATEMIRWLVWLLIGISTQMCAAKSAPGRVPLCDLERGAKEGEGRSVRVAGIYYSALEGSVLEDPACDDSSTWVEFDLRSTVNKEELSSIVKSKRHARVVVEGDFFGPRQPDPSLPEVLRKSYHPGWGHLGAFRTQLVVHVIRSAKADKQKP
jgi:hypothetical protein